MQEEPRKAEGTEFSKQTATVEGLFFLQRRGLQGEELHMCEANLRTSPGITWILQVPCKCTAIKKKRKTSRKRSSLVLVTTAGVTSTNHRIGHLQALLAGEKPQAGSSDDLAAAETPVCGGRRACPATEIPKHPSVPCTCIPLTWQTALHRVRSPSFPMP